MNKSNFALITALYDTHTSEFYNDVYFPAIKYGLFLLYRSQVDMEKYYIVENLQEIIKEQFGVCIPLIVIKQAMKLINSTHTDFSINFLSRGDQFSIKKVWDISVADSIDNQYEQRVKAFIALEKLFADYSLIQHNDNEKTFISFFSDNTEEIYNYINGDKQSLLVNEEYIHVINFLKWLEINNSEIYNTASDIFWGSIIAAFLRRDTDILIKPEIRVSYYLDSSLVLSLLDLDSQANHQYSTELLEIIKASGNHPCVHPLTIREIDSILYSVERDGAPRPNSGIADAYYRRDLSPSKILHIKQNLKKLIEQIVSIDNTPESVVDEIILKYKGKSSVKALAETRASQHYENIRDIHDVYMLDFVKQKQSKATAIEKCNIYFVSLNSDLKDLYPTIERHQLSSVIHPSRIVTDLWIHNSKTTIIKKDALTEVMARCTALNQTDVRRKLRLVSKYYKTEEFSKEKYEAVFLAVANRSKSVISNTLQLSRCDSSNMSETDIKQAQEYAQNIVKLSQEFYKGITDANIELHNKLEELKEFAIAQIETSQTKESQFKEKELQQKELTSHLHKTNDYKDEMINLQLQLHNFEKDRDSSINMWLYWIPLLLQGIFSLILIIALIIEFTRISWDWSSIKANIINNTTLIIGFAVTGLTLILAGCFKLSIFRPKNAYKQHKLKLQQEWESYNPTYTKVITHKKELERLIRENNESIILLQKKINRQDQ